MKNNWKIEEILTLKFLKNYSNKRIIEIVNNYDSFDAFIGSGSDIFFSQTTLLTESPKNLIITAKEKALQQLEAAERNDSSIVSYWSEVYPVNLKEIEAPPIILYVKGKLQTAASPALAIVGTRHCTVYGKLVTERFAEYFAQREIIICSGLAYGIDTTAHKTVLSAGGITYAVIASGIDSISVDSQNKLAEKICENNGALISEYEFGITAKPGYFPIRNRIISGISKATLVIESGEKGGSLITARFAFDQERDVYAVPGSIHSDKSKGTNLLIKNNIAIPALSPEGVFREIGFHTKLSSIFENKKNRKLSDNGSVIFDSLSFEPMQIDELTEKTGLEVSVLLVELLNLEFNGIVRQLPGKYYIKVE